MTCTHVYTLFRTGQQPPRLLCMFCCAPKPPEPCGFVVQGDADRKTMEATHGR